MLKGTVCTAEPVVYRFENECRLNSYVEKIFPRHAYSYILFLKIRSIQNDTVYHMVLFIAS